MAAVMDTAPKTHEEWLVHRAKSLLKSDQYAAKAWLITARTLFPRHFHIQYEAYSIEKAQKHSKEAAKLLEEMFKNFPMEPQLWNEVTQFSEALQTSTPDATNEFLKGMFNALPMPMQRHLLQRVVESTTDILQRCSVARLLLERHPDTGADTGVKLLEALLSAEKHSHHSTPVNCYRKYMVCDILPLVLNGALHDAPQKQLQRWLQKSVEFFVCYTFQFSHQDSVLHSPDMVSPTKTSFHSGGMWGIAGLPERDASIDNPWDKMAELLHLFASHFGWDVHHLPTGPTGEWQWQQVMDLHHTLVNNPTSASESANAAQRQLLYSALVTFFHSLHSYTLHMDPDHGGGTTGTREHSLVLVESLKSNKAKVAEPKAKRLKAEAASVKIVASKNITGGAEIIDRFHSALQYWHILHSQDLIGKEFNKLCQHWKTENWPWLRNFLIDVALYEGQFANAMTLLQKIQIQPKHRSAKLRADLQLACCHYSVGNLSKAFEIIMNVVASLPPVTETHDLDLELASKGRMLHLMMCSGQEVLPYCVHLLITCLKDRAFRGNRSEDILLAHLLVLLQYDWPRYETTFMEVIERIQRASSFTYNSFFSYIITGDILEEFAYLRTAEGGKVQLDILPTSTKALAQQRTVTRGLNKGVKEDFKVQLEKQMSLCGENIENIIRMFLTEEQSVLLQNL